jgi:hypothetical protein
VILHTLKSSTSSWFPPKSPRFSGGLPLCIAAKTFLLVVVPHCPLFFGGRLAVVFFTLCLSSRRVFPLVPRLKFSFPLPAQGAQKQKHQKL